MGIDPRLLQEVGWAGYKDYGCKPMVKDVNESIARTSILTGLPQEEVYKRYMRKSIPMYGAAPLAAGAAIGGSLLAAPDEQPSY